MGIIHIQMYGERAPRKGQYAPVIGIFMRQKEAGELLTIVGDGSQRRDFVYVGDVVNANILAATKDVDAEASQILKFGISPSFNPLIISSPSL